jgi:sugar-specific transcriptional regulator TrmB
MHEPRKHLLSLGLAESEVTVYLAMLQGSITASTLIKTTDLKRPTVYYALGCLEKRGLVGKTGSEGDKRFFVEPPEKLQSLVNEKINEVSLLKDHINEIIPILNDSTQSEKQRPVVTYYEGVPAVQGVIMDMLYAKEKEISSLVPKENFFWSVGENFVKRYVTERTRRNIHTRNLWEQKVKPSVMKQYYGASSQVRIMPNDMHNTFETSIFIYNTSVLYISSKKQAYAILITSSEHTKMMLSLFNSVWIRSEKHP